MSSNKKHCNQDKKKTSLKVLNAFIFTALIIVGGFYLFNINQVTVDGFVIQELKTEVDYLAEKNRGLEEEVNANQSYYAFSSRIDSLKMVEANDVIYLTRNDQVLAKK
ncbi:MAG: hypothetical protein PF488_02130 [Patescibacteria group bacterium]|jgi:FtsZ-binding cell division protein ZapB|nr:hypothetical protein [Patescibacteria group bacterium]